MEIGLFRRWKFISAIVLLLCSLPDFSVAEEFTVGEDIEKIKLKTALQRLTEKYNVYFTYDKSLVQDITVDYREQGRTITEALQLLLEGTDLHFKIFEDQFVIIYKLDQKGIRSLKSMVEHFTNIIAKDEARTTFRPVPKLGLRQAWSPGSRKLTGLALSINGTVTDQQGEPLIGVNVQVKGANKGTATDFDGNYRLDDVSENATLVFSYIGYQMVEVPVDGRSEVSIELVSDSEMLDEVVVVGYGTQTKSDLTGSVVRVGEGDFKERPNVSIMQSLQGAVPGMNIGQVNSAGGEPSLSIRGRTSLSGTQDPLIVLDGVIFRGNLIDINPSDIETIDILKDASSSAIYGSQASNGVVIITTKSGGLSEKPIINFSSNFSFQQPTKRFFPESPEEHLSRIEAAYFYDSRTKESGYLEPNPDWDISSTFRTSDQLRAYNNNIVTDWYNIITNDKMHLQNHNLSLSKRTANSGYFLSIGFVDQVGYMVNEDYKRWNARINVDNSINEWMEVGVQSFLTSSDYSGADISPNNRYDNRWFSPAFNEDGLLLESPRGVGGEGSYNPYYLMNSDDIDQRLNIFGNIYADIKVPFIEGLSFKTNFNINRISTSRYFYQSFANNFLGIGEKSEGIRNEWTNDNIITYKNTFNGIHKVNLTLLYGREKRNYRSTVGRATDFVSDELGFNRLQAGNSELQSANSSAWSEASLYNMARIFYGYRNKYLFTGTIRRDGFSGFSKDNKFGIFPSVSLAWVISEESFFKESIGYFDFLKLRLSYGTNGNRTISRYQTLARVGGGFNYLNGNSGSIYTQSITDLASPNLKWETTTGINIGIDFSIFNERLKGNIDYYNNNTEDILYNVDIPGISRFESFPDNLGEMENYGMDISITSLNIRRDNFEWSTQLVYSRNRNKLKELLGFDNNGDGKEDDLVSEGLFIGEPLSTIFTYSTNGELWQLGDDIPPTADVGSYKIDDLNGDGMINPDDRTIIGYSAPAYRFSINNQLKYKNWTLSLFINSIQGGGGYYLGQDILEGFGVNSLIWDNTGFPQGLDFWIPENPNAKYQRLNVQTAGGLGTSLYTSRGFVRLKDVNLSYRFSTDLIEKLSVSSLSIFFNGKNLLTFTKWPGWDPETGQKISSSGRPVMRNYTFGLNLNF